MAKTQQQPVVTKRIEGKKHRKGVHSKSRTSYSKTSKYYVKEYKGQGR